MTSACDIAFRGNPGNSFPSILRNLVFERPPLHAWLVFLLFLHPLCLYVSIKKRTWHCFVSASNSSTANFHTRRNSQLISFSSISFLNAPYNTAMPFSFLFLFFEIYVLCHPFHHPQPSSTTSSLAKSKYVFTLTISLSHCRVSKIKHCCLSNIHFYFW